MSVQQQKGARDACRKGVSNAPWWARVAAIYVASRVLALAVLAWEWARGVPEQHTVRGDLGFLGFLSRTWDGAWYAQIAESGYPAELPRAEASAQVEQSAWAFFPLYPAACRAVMTVTGLPWDVVGPALSMTFGLAAMLVLFMLVRESAPELVARRPLVLYAAVWGMSLFPSAGAFSLAYSDSLALLLLVLSLLLIVRGRYVTAIAPVLALGLTRAIALPLAAVVVWQVIVMMRRRGTWRVLGKTQTLGAVALTGAGVAAGFVWPTIVGMVLGRSDAYLLAQSPWRRLGDVTTDPFSGWTGRIDTWVGWVVFAGFVLAVVLGSFSSFAVSLGPVLQSWGGAYAGYLVAASVLGASTPRYFLLVLVLQIAVVAWARTATGVVVAASLLGCLQVLWIHGVLTVMGFTP